MLFTFDHLLTRENTHSKNRTIRVSIEQTTLTPFCKKDRTKGTTGRQISKAKPTQGLSCKKKKEKGRWKRFEIPIGHQMTLGERGLSTLGKEQDEDRFERSLAL